MTSKSHTIGSIGEFMAWTKAIVNDPTIAAGAPSQWFDTEECANVRLTHQGSLLNTNKDVITAEAMVKLLSTDNITLLGIIATAKPRSMKQLADLVGRKESNLSRTLKKLELAGIIKFFDGDGRARMPVLIATRITLAIDLTGADKSAVAVERKPGDLVAA